MYFNYFYDLIDCEPEEENDKYYLPIITIICEETLRFGGSIVHHHGIGKARAPWVHDEYGTSYPMLEALKHGVRPERRDEHRDDHPAQLIAEPTVGPVIGAWCARPARTGVASACGAISWWMAFGPHEPGCVRAARAAVTRAGAPTAPTAARCPRRS